MTRGVGATSPLRPTPQVGGDETSRCNVIPAQAGIQESLNVYSSLHPPPAAGMTVAPTSHVIPAQAGIQESLNVLNPDSCKFPLVNSLSQIPPRKFPLTNSLSQIPPCKFS